MIRVSDWLKKARKDRFIFCVLYTDTHTLRVILRKGPMVDRRKWEVIKLEIGADGFRFSRRYAGWYRDIASEKWVKILFRF